MDVLVLDDVVVAEAAGVTQEVDWPVMFVKVGRTGAEDVLDKLPPGERANSTLSVKKHKQKSVEFSILTGGEESKLVMFPPHPFFFVFLPSKWSEMFKYAKKFFLWVVTKRKNILGGSTQVWKIPHSFFFNPFLNGLYESMINVEILMK